MAGRGYPYAGVVVGPNGALYGTTGKEPMEWGPYLR